MITKRNPKTGRIISDYPDTEDTQYCPACKTNKTFDNFYKDKRGINGLTRRCKRCWSSKSYYSRTRSAESIEKAYWRVTKNKYGITKEDFYSIADKQNNKCKICKQETNTHKRLVIDHNHKTGRVRGLLCGQCNAALGLLRDDIKILQEAINYLSCEGGVR